MRRCIFGGSFDPPHAGHLHIAVQAQLKLSIDQVLWLPAPQPPHKSEPETPFEHRLALTQLAVANLKGHEVSAIEKDLPAPHYSLHSIEALQSIYGKEGTWFFLIGTDNWNTIKSWHAWEKVLSLVTFLVYPREGYPYSGGHSDAIYLDLPPLNQDSTSIRKDLKNKLNLEQAHVLPALWEYIQQHHLYGF